MQAWAPDNAALADAALFHSVYGTEGFRASPSRWTAAATSGR